MKSTFTAIMLACLSLALAPSAQARVHHHHYRHHWAGQESRPFAWGDGWTTASVYGGERHHNLCGGPTASGERFNCGALTAAHRTLPFGAKVRVCGARCTVVRINDRGPFVRGRGIDLSPASARAIGVHGLGKVRMQRASYWHHGGSCGVAARLGGPCGCRASIAAFGHSVRELWLAAAWYQFPRTSPHVGAAAIWPGGRKGARHVAIVTAVHGDGTVATTDHNRVSIGRLVFVEPRRKRNG